LQQTAHLPDAAPDAPEQGETAVAVDPREAAVAEAQGIARLYGEPLLRLPNDLYIPPDALEIFLDAFEGPLDLLLYLIRKQNFNILDIPMAQVTQQYLVYVDQIRLQQPGAGGRVPADGGHAHRDQVAHAAAEASRPSRARRRPTRAPNWCAACSNTSRSSWPPTT
jgi:hypothetical protein